MASMRVIVHQNSKGDNVTMMFDDDDNTRTPLRGGTRRSRPKGL